MPWRPRNYTLLRGFDSESTPLTAGQIQRQRWNRRRLLQWVIPALLASVFIFTLTIVNAKRGRDDGQEGPDWSLRGCEQFPAFGDAEGERGQLEKEIRETIESEEFEKRSLERLQGAVRIPTESFDGMGEVGVDGRWEVFAEFHEYLKGAFPLVFKKLTFTPINTYGILLEWKGKDDSLKPYLFMAHQDVVPVPKDTEERWKYPPFSAYYDGRFIWGRGASDCKNVLIGVLEAFETLLEKGYIPQRTLLTGFGFDEEITGWYGARYISQHLEKTWGKDSIVLIIDEGELGIKEIDGAVFALPALGEKGYLDVRITVETEGGHSSVPPDHTGIGILSQIISAIEASPYEPELTPINPYFTTLQCTAEHAPSLPTWLRSQILKSKTSKNAAKAVANYLSKDKSQRYLMQTSQAADLIAGGVKINALPEKVEVVINHRIAVESRVADIRERLKSVITSKILGQFDMKLNAWGENITSTSSSNFPFTFTTTNNTAKLGLITLSDFDEPLEPSPVSPFDTEAYKVLSGAIKQAFGKKGEEVYVAPSLMTGNTDTKFYWGLSRNIYRFAPVREGGRENAHTVDERVGLREHVEGVAFYVELILGGER